MYLTEHIYGKPETYRDVLLQYSYFDNILGKETIKFIVGYWNGSNWIIDSNGTVLPNTIRWYELPE